MYCLVVTDDYSRFSLVFFLANKDETNGILKAFIIGIENLIGHKVKIIRCDNGTEFKNKEMNQFCEKKGIKREFSVARTPQQNGVAERKNRRLIEASKTMLVDSKLPTTFWDKAVNTACYVQNKVLVIKPHNKTPYELFHGKARVEKVPDRDYILLPLWTQYPLFSSSSKDSPGDGFKPLRDAKKKDAKDTGNEDNDVLSTKEPRVNQEKDVNDNSTNNINPVSPTANAASTKDNVVDEDIVYGCVDDLNMPNLEDIVYSNEDEDVGAEADMTNLDTNIC
nr:putative ribonuclease H-like domain-containing protein [Tanacetum cinerariifolium]